MKPDIDQSDKTVVQEIQHPADGVSKALKVRRQTARLIKQASVKPAPAVRHEVDGLSQQDAPRITARFVCSAEPTTEAQDLASFNAVQRALHKLLLDRGYDLAAIAGASQADSIHKAANTTLLDETR